ncbi:solute carrier family 13 (sodium-dependent dicarboxylate transporter), member 2/3/5 [Altererythrobacter xiamenensis]|uniref:Solute carrier family 13 (Sodium-dependent dicarboxylate transporter), member 2/3/5 n=1 Tax=Altererythrobacter xiamenensis TaxID=1316679 RepID=A0A1Y6F4M3_9SPHN|nr:DASS family sodium-coupled anion symporter [Altererythrobacter xiamenensis]SMQ69834.1 solute carrier family 13 (sodium-dependent dicarboxylate transporter), member 2/3/5 [Altererythrobacter xiamenensis]
MTARKIGLVLGPFAFALTVFTAPPAGMSEGAWLVAGLVMWMAAWWMTEAIPLTATALLPFVVLPLGGVMNARDTASAYYAPILFLLLGGAFIALAIERTGLHRRLSLAILKTIGTSGGQSRLLLAFMISAAILSMLISNTSTTLIMMPMALAVLSGGGLVAEDHEGMSGALPMGIAFAASIGGLGTIVGSPTNGIAVALLDDMIGLKISFADWMFFGIPIVILGVPLAAFLISKVQNLATHPFDMAAARQSIDDHKPWSSAEKRLVPIIAITFLLWMSRRWIEPYLPENSWTDGTIAIIASLALFLLPDGSGRPLLKWEEADRAPWGVIMMFGGGLALAAGMQASGLADWLGNALLPLEVVPLIVIALAIVAMVVLVTEFASNVATASAIIPVVASLAAALGLGEQAILLAMPAALAASWGFILPAGTGPNAIAWSTGRLRIGRLVKAGFLLDLVGIFLIVGMVWVIAAVA